MPINKSKEKSEVAIATNLLIQLDKYTSIKSLLRQEENEEIRLDPIAVVEKLLYNLEQTDGTLSKFQRERIIDEYIKLFSLEKDDKTIKENTNRFRPYLREQVPDDLEFKEKYINPIVRLMPQDIILETGEEDWVEKLENKLIQKLLWDKSGNSLNNDYLHND